MRIADAESGAGQVFSLGTTIRGLPATRNAENLRAIVPNRGAFLRYLRLFLAGPSAPIGRRRGSADAGWQAAEDMVVLEAMVPAPCGDARRRMGFPRGADTPAPDP